MIWLVEPPEAKEGVCMICKQEYKKWGEVGNTLRLGLCKKCAKDLIFDEDEE